MTIETLLSRLDKVRPNGNQKWMACCPAHQDKTPSLAIAQANDGRVLLKCFAGCDALSILQAVNLQMADLFPDGALGNLKGWFTMEREKADYREKKKQDALSLEYTVLEIAKQDRANGKRLSQADMEREKQAWMRIRNANANR